MVAINYNGKNYQLKEQQTVLDCLLENNESISYFCKSGLCQSCTMAIEHGNIPLKSQFGLSEAEKMQSHFLPCLSKPTQDIFIKKCNESKKKYACIVQEKIILAAGVIILKIKHPLNYQFFPGQYVNIKKPSGEIRCYSIASLQSEKCEIELHIKYYENGKLTSWLYNEIQIGDTLFISEALGQCFYSKEARVRKLLLIGVGTGLAPLIGIARHALSENHLSEIHIVQGGLNIQSLYANPLLIDLSLNNKNFKVHTCILQDADNPERTKDIHSYVEEHFSDLTNWEVYICGGDDFVKKTQELVFLSGADGANIHSDIFVVSS
ncbi:FAD-binding oxidoreductase [Fluviispira sanaruensis]|uniref:Ferredoxin n=1 Tax=Fluviispira sanaruensis TaxID=2493639 RepID=A0A4P2VQH2_FLUSA|nr:2Fe-2S iron-sulfur cluster binding domain-containing protein [Fluviispira sanaruensis]BBH54259.1 ferredoxin [Fluviispira sanaruensis]